MAKFKEYLELEGLPPNEQIYNYKMATVNRFDSIKEKNLKVLRVKEGINFKKQARRFLLNVPDDDQSKAYFVKNKIILDCRAKVQNITSPEDFRLDIETNIKDRRIPDSYLKYLDYDAIYWQLIQYKNEKKYCNFCLEKNILPNIMGNYDWYYGLIIPEEELKLNTFEKANKATSYVTLVLQSYIDKYYTYQKNKWEAPYLVYQDITPDDHNFVSEYTFSYQPEHSSDVRFKDLEKYVNDINLLLSRDKAILGKGMKLFSDGLITFDFPHHLFVPLVYKSEKLTTVQVSPVSLNNDEKNFVFLLSEYLSDNGSQFKNIDIFLLRNKSKVGMGFFEAGNFYPDYILWIDTKDTQYMTFIDPKGLQYHQKTDPKIQFYKTIKELEQRPLLQKTKGNKEIILNSFIISGSSYVTIKNKWGIPDNEKLSDMHILFLDQEDCIKSMFGKLLGI
jgi:hypothetical protein